MNKRLMGLRYDGTFELAFLLNNEAVRSQGEKDAQGKPTGAIEILRNGKIVAYANVGDWIHRQADGSIRVFEPSQIDTGKFE